MIERGCDLARRMADRLGGSDGVHVINDVVLNQVLVAFDAADRPDDPAAADEFTAAVIEAVQRDGTCWLGGTTWHGRTAMRISVSNWMTTEGDIDVSADAILRCARETAEARLTPA
jgi:glutamate/tyrosine decarboxylase-like PLP-dependent enzyme